MRKEKTQLAACCLTQDTWQRADHATGSCAVAMTASRPHQRAVVLTADRYQDNDQHNAPRQKNQWPVLSRPYALERHISATKIHFRKAENQKCWWFMSKSGNRQTLLLTCIRIVYSQSSILFMPMWRESPVIIVSPASLQRAPLTLSRLERNVRCLSCFQCPPLVFTNHTTFQTC